MGRELEDYLSSRLDKVSPRTIHRWIKFVKELEHNEQTFDYYPQINLPSFGLTKNEVLFKEPRDARILDVIPHIYWAGIVRDRLFSEYIVAHYLVPAGEDRAFLEVLGNMEEMGLYEEQEVYPLRSGLFIPSPFYEIIDENGNLRLDGNIDNSAFVNGQSVSDGTVQIIDESRRSPLIVPLVFEADKESIPFESIWQGVRARLGESLTDYCKGYKNSLPTEAKKGSSFVQRTFHDINRSFDRFYEHMRVYYKPLYQIPNVQMLNLSLSFDPERSKEMLETVTRISERCLYLTSYFTQSDGNRVVRMNILTTFEQYFTVLIWVKHRGLGFDYYFVDRTKSWNLWDRNYSKFAYWELFDPRSVSWKFDPDRYMAKAESLSLSKNLKF